jgi:protein SCO1/2
MRPCVDRLRFVLIGLALAGGARAEGVPKLDERQAVTHSQAVIGTQPADFTLLDRRERPVSLASYRGKPLLVSFIYTGCFTICPTQTRSLHTAVKGLDRMLGPHQFNVVSIGFNQPFDSPQAMRAFAAQQRVDYQNWEFLSPARNQVDALTQAYGFSYVETPAGFDHIVGVTVLDAQGRIHRQVYGDGLTAEALGKPLRELILHAPIEGPVPTLEQLVDRVRILCTVYDPDTGEYRYNWRLLWEIIGGTAFFITGWVYMLREWRSQRRAREAAARGAQLAAGKPGAVADGAH